MENWRTSGTAEELPVHQVVAEGQRPPDFEGRRDSAPHGVGGALRGRWIRQGIPKARLRHVVNPAERLHQVSVYGAGVTCL